MVVVLTDFVIIYATGLHVLLEAAALARGNPGTSFRLPVLISV